MTMIDWRQGDTLPILKLPLIPDSGTFDITSLNASNFVLKLVNIDNEATKITGTGIFSNLTAASGSNPAYIMYHLSATDVSTPGKYKIFAEITYTGPETTTYKSTLVLEINAR